MSQLHRPVAEVEPAGEAGPHRARSFSAYWPPRPATVVAALVVASSLYWMTFVDQDFARNLSKWYGWPFRYHFMDPRDAGPARIFYTAALAADLAISVALLASACAVTQIAAHLLVRSPRLTLRIIGFLIVAIALLLAGYRWKVTFLVVFSSGFFYSLVSLIVLVVCLLLHLELPEGGNREQRS
jgi:hypothetical protein